MKWGNMIMYYLVKSETLYIKKTFNVSSFLYNSSHIFDLTLYSIYANASLKHAQE